MNRSTAILVLALAALLEAGGDAIVRTALHRSTGASRFTLFVVGAIVLFLYGYTVNAPPWDFGRLLGLYVVFFFIAAQLISWLAFGQPPSRAVLIGGLLIISGGLVISLSEA
jgi:drug/metabolite transporter superfamily protein YnfA